MILLVNCINYHDCKTSYKLLLSGSNNLKKSPSNNLLSDNTVNDTQNDTQNDTLNDTLNDTVNDTVNELKLSKAEQLILNIISLDGNVTRNNICKQTNLSLRTVARVLNSLKSKKAIYRVG